MMRIAILGGGIVGASIAYHLARQGARITLVEQSAPASGATDKSFGWINANFAETPEYYRLRRAAIDAYQALAPHLPEAVDLQWGGSLWWEDTGADLLAHAQIQQNFGYDAEIVDQATFRDLEPEVAQPPDACIHARAEGSVDTLKLTQWLLEQAAANGAHLLFGCTATGILKNRGRAVGLQTSTGDIRADRVVVAAGAWGQTFLAAHGVHLPMDNRGGLIMHTQPVRRVIKHLILSPEIHFRQCADGRLIVGEIFGGDRNNSLGVAADPVALAENILARLKAKLPGVDGLAIARIMTGTRPVPADGLPVVGPSPEMPGLYLASMHSGITLAPLVGRLAAAEILGQEKSDLLDSFRPSRFVKSTL